MNAEETKNEDIQLIHSSHSKNIKYLLDGSMHTQKNAEKYAAIFERSDKSRIISVLDSQSIIIVNGSKIEIHGHSIYNDLIYVFETLLNTFMESIGGIALHAASCTIDNRGIIVCGTSGSGKTSLLFDLINSNGAIFHSNDRIVIYKEKSSVFICGIPIPVNVPYKTMKKFSNAVSDEIMSIAEDGAKIRFQVNEIPLLFKKYERKDIILSDIFITDYSASKPQMDKLQLFDAISSLDLLSPVDENHPNWLGVFYPSYSNNQCTTLLVDYLADCNLCRVSGNSLIVAVKNGVISNDY